MYRSWSWKKVSFPESQLIRMVSELVTPRTCPPLVSDLLPDFERFGRDHLPQSPTKLEVRTRIPFCSNERSEVQVKLSSMGVPRRHGLEFGGGEWWICVGSKKGYLGF